MANVSKIKVPNGTTYNIKDSTARSNATAANTLATLAMNNIATIESSTASKAYSVGDYLVLNGQLYEVTTAIDSGDTLTVGTNISATTVGDELTSLNNGLASLIRTTTASGTTSSSGALATPVNTSTYAILSTRCTSGNNYFAMGRGDNYFTCFKVSNNALVTAANEALTFEVVYVKKD